MTPLDPFRGELAGVTFVEASAGTGKTFAIEMLYLRLLVESGLTPEQIVVVTYTNAAAGELRARIRRRIQEASDWLARASEPDKDWKVFLGELPDAGQARRRLLRAQYGFDGAAISTIHGFCQRVLQEHAFDSGAAFGVDMIADQSALLDEVVRDYVSRALHAASPSELEQIWGHDAFSAMTGFASRVAAQPDLALVPRGIDVEAFESDWREVFDRAAVLWQDAADTILALATENKAIHQGAAAKRPEAERGLRAVFATREPLATKRYENLKKLGATFLATKTNKNRETPRHEFFDSIDRLIEIETGLRSGWRIRFFRGLADFARDEIRLRKQRQGTVYFDDLLLNLHDALRGAGGEQLAGKLRGRFQAALIDEFQDTDPIQYAIFERIFVDAERPLFLIGDPKQSIYAFRGADVHTYVAAGEGRRRRSLATNWRSSDRAVAAVNQLFARPGAFVLDEIDFQPVESCKEKPELVGEGTSGVRFLWCEPPESGENLGDFTRAIGRGVASRIVELLESGQTIGDETVSPEHIAVLCRTNDQAGDLQAELRRRGVPSVLTGDRSVFETPEAADLARVLNALVDPRDAVALRAAMCTPLCGVGGDELVRLRDDEPGWQTWAERFRRWRARWDEKGFMAAFSAIRDDCDSTAKLLAVRGGERRLTNYLHLAELLQVASREQRRGPDGLVEWLRLMSSGVGDSGELAAESVQVRLESDADAVVLTTIHKSKGLEYPIVFLPFLWTKPKKVRKTMVSFVDESRARAVFVGPEAPDSVIRSATDERDGEDMRLTYVALTRARQSSFVVAAPYRDGLDSSLARLLGGLARERIEDIAAASDDTIGVETLRASNRRWQPRQTRQELEPPPAARTVAADWRVSSFSGLTRRSDELSAQEEEGRDRDQVELLPVDELAASAVQEVRLADLETGTRLGLMVHSIFEDLDFAVEDREELRKLVDAKAESFRAGRMQVEMVTDGLRDILDTPLPGLGGDFALREIERSRRLDELEFTLPVSSTGGPLLSASSFATVLQSHGAPTADPDYAARLRDLRFTDFAGYLRGYIDLVFEHAGRWYVVDYKSNLLGRCRDAYAPARLAGAMRHHDYFLQYLLYVVATDRYLRHRLPAYSYEQHFGGVFYLFLRGMDPGYPGEGVYYDRPSAGLVDDLSKLFDGGSGERR